MLKMTGMVKCAVLRLRGPAVPFGKKRLQQPLKDKKWKSSWSYWCIE